MRWEASTARLLSRARAASRRELRVLAGCDYSGNQQRHFDTHTVCIAGLYAHRDVAAFLRHRSLRSGIRNPCGRFEVQEETPNAKRHCKRCGVGRGASADGNGLRHEWRQSHEQHERWWHQLLDYRRFRSSDTFGAGVADGAATARVTTPINHRGCGLKVNLAGRTLHSPQPRIGKHPARV